MPQVQNPSAAPILTRITNVTSAQLKALGTPTNVTLVPAPGAGKIIAVQSIALTYLFGTIAYGNQTSSAIIFEGDLDNDLFPTFLVQSILQATRSRFAISPVSLGDSVNILPGDDNTAVVLIGAGFELGPIVTATLGAGGAGYAANDTGTITTGGGNATYRVLTVGGGGAVLTFSITAPGTAYPVGNGQATATGGAQPGAGAGFTVNITAVQTGDGTLKVTTYYSIIPVP